MLSVQPKPMIVALRNALLYTIKYHPVYGKIDMQKNENGNLIVAGTNGISLCVSELPAEGDAGNRILLTKAKAQHLLQWIKTMDPVKAKIELKFCPPNTVHISSGGQEFADEMNSRWESYPTYNRIVSNNQNHDTELVLDTNALKKTVNDLKRMHSRFLRVTLESELDVLKIHGIRVQATRESYLGPATVSVEMGPLHKSLQYAQDKDIRMMFNHRGDVVRVVHNPNDGVEVEHYFKTLGIQYGAKEAC